ncbi:MAG: OB-fold nucleic acid binding domain-containing protein [Chloroflexota bacterium]
MSHCPSCGQFVGPRDTCPHCGARLGERLALRAIQIVAVTVTVAGLLLLWLLARHTQPPTIPIGQVGATMNLAYVRLQGQVTRGPSFDPETRSLGFWLADESGEIYVAAYRQQVDELLTSGQVPALGDGVSVAGTLRLRQDFVSLTINAADQLHVTSPSPIDRTVAEIDPYSALERVRLRGQVRQVREPYQGLTLIGLRDASGAIEIAVPQETLLLSGDLPPLSPGQAVAVEGAVTFYQETAQLTLTDAADLTPLPETADVAPVRSISALGPEDAGGWIGLEGFILDVAPFSAGVKLTLDDGSGEITVLLWQDLYDSLVATTPLETGAAVRVCGELAEYRGELELIPELPVDVRLAAAPLPPEAAAVSALSAADVGRRVEISGTLHGVDPFSAGVKFALDDGTGQITLLLWQSVYDEIAAAETLAAGTRVIVVGEVSEYRGELELIPRRAADLTVTGYAPLPAPTPVPIARLGARDLDQTVSLAGAVGEPQPFSAGVKYTLDDGSGQITLLLWQDVADALGEALPAGARVQVTGQIGEYLGELEIIPRTAGDISVLARPTATPTPTATPVEPPTATPQPVCTLPPCREGEVYYCPGECPGGCGTECVTPTPAPSPTPTPTPTPSHTPSPTPDLTTPIGQVDAGRTGETLTLRGQVIAAANFASGFKFTLDDGTGQIVLLLWGDVYDAVAGVAGLNTGATVRVSGQIGTYDGEVQIAPAAAGDIAIESAGAGPDAPQRQIGSLSAADAGALVEIEGAVSRVEPFSSGLRIYLSDGSGEVMLLLWQIVADRAPERDRLLQGAQVRAVGQVGEYKGTLQIIPRLPFDVHVLEAGENP